MASYVSERSVMGSFFRYFSLVLNHDCPLNVLST